jgi:dGTPase
LNEDLAEAIGLAHDIGYAPFGHQGERFLSAIIHDSDCALLKQRMPSFSHEVYGLRVVDSIAKRDREPPGLYLMWEVRDGIVSHCGEDFETCRLEPGSREKDLEAIQTRDDAGNPATLEGCIVRLIDKIAYAGKDVEDAIEVKLITAGQVPVEIRERLGVTNGQIVRTLVRDMVRHSSGKDYIAISPDLGVLLHDLIQFNSKRIYHTSQAEGYKNQAGKTIRYVCDDLLAELRNRGRFASDRYPPSEDKNDPIPFAYRILQQFVVEDMRSVYTADDPDELIILDFVAGMTDSFAVRCVSDVFIPKMVV